MSLEGKRVVLTGGAGGLGELVAGELLSAGADLTVIERVDELPYDATTYFKGDLSTPDGLAEIRSILRASDWDILINMAGMLYFGPFEDQTPSHIQTSYMVNLVAPVLLAQSVVPAMRRRGSGQIVNIGSVFGSINFAHFVTYSSTKAGLKGFSEALRRELHGTGIDVTYIAPRAVKTPLNTRHVMQFAEATGMKLDEPDIVAHRIVRAIAGRKKDVYIGFPESLFVRMNALLPRLVDAALVKNDRQASAIFAASVN